MLIILTIRIILLAVVAPSNHSNPESPNNCRSNGPGNCPGASPGNTLNSPINLTGLSDPNSTNNLNNPISP